jgi:hypothetical protein
VKRNSKFLQKEHLAKNDPGKNLSERRTLRAKNDPGEEISGRKIIRAKRNSKFLQKKTLGEEFSGVIIFCLIKKLGEKLSALV